MKAITPGNEIADEFLRLAIFAKPNARLGGGFRGIEIMDAGVFDFEENLAAGGEARIGLDPSPLHVAHRS